MEVTTAIHMVEIVAQGLGKLRDQMVFVGGSTMSLYVDDPAVSTPRPTDDVDCAVEISTRQDYHKLEKELRALGFKNEIGKSVPVCRWKYSGITVDIMPTDEKILGFSNRWYPAGIASAENVCLPSKLQISIFALPYFIASKFEALMTRGKGDPRFSSDFEDIVYVLNGSVSAESKLRLAPTDVRNYLAEKYRKLASGCGLEEAIIAHLGNEGGGTARAKRIMKMLEGVNETEKGGNEP